MSSGSSIFESDAGRGFEIVCGVILLAPALMMLAGAIAIIVVSPWEYGHLAALVFILLGWSLSRVSIRLIRGRGRPDGALFSPWAITVGAVIFAIGGIGLLMLGLIERHYGVILLGLGNLPAAYFAWNLASRRRKQNDTWKGAAADD